MEEFKLCSDGEFMPVSLPCPPPYSGPYYYPYENIPFPPAQGITGTSSEGGGGGGGSSVSAGAVAGIIILVSFIFFTMCVCAVKFRNRSLNIFGYTLRSLRRNNEGQGAAGDQYLLNGGHEMVVNNAGGGLEKKLVSLLPVFEYVGLQGSKLQDHSFQKESSSTECAVCLSSFEEQEIVRVLPKCHHCFHVPCIDKWFESHANCPLCRETITLQSIQLYFKHPHIPNYSPDQLPAQAPGLLPDQQAAGPPAEDQDSEQPARPGVDHHANNQLSTGLLMPPAGTLLSCAHPAIENQHQNDQLHSAAKNLHDRQIAGPACDHHVSDQQGAGLACPDLQGLDHHQNLSAQDVPAGAANDHRLQIDQHPENQPCPYQRIDQPARHVGGYQISDHHQKGVKGHQDLSSNATIAGAGRNDQPCKADHQIELEMMRGSDQKRVYVNPKSLRGDDKKATSNTGSSDEVFLYVNDFDKKTGNSEHVVVYIGPDHPRTSFSNFKRSLSTGCLSIDRSKLRHSLLAGTAREMH